MPLSFVLSLLRKPLFVIQTLVFSVFEVFVNFKFLRVTWLFVFANKLKEIGWLVLINFEIQRMLLDKSRSGFCGLEIVHQVTLLCSEYNSIVHVFLLGFQTVDILEECHL